jgi:hypothetical protein
MPRPYGIRHFGSSSYSTQTEKVLQVVAPVA